MLLRVRNIFPFVLLIFFTAHPVYNQRLPNPSAPVMVVHGIVRYRNSNTPAENVLVRLEDVSGSVVQQVVTDRLGKFQFSGLQPEQYRVVARSPGFEEAQQQLDLKTGPTAYVILQLAPGNSSERKSVGVIDVRVSPEARKEFEHAGEIMNGKTSRERLGESVRHLEKAIKIDPAFFEAQLMLGTVHMDLGNWQKAETALRAALKLEAKSMAAHVALGETLKRQKKLNDAESVLKEALSLDNSSWHAHYQLATVFWEMGDLKKAGPEVARALQLKPDFADGYLLAGNILLRAHQAENALPQFEEYLRLAPDGPFAVDTRALVNKIKKALSEKKPAGQNL